MAPPSPGFTHIPAAVGGVASGVEQSTGRFHTDGKAIYRKVFTGTLNGSGVATVAHSITWDEVVGVEVILSDGSTVFKDNSYYNTAILTATNITISHTNAASYGYVVTVDYTK